MKTAHTAPQGALDPRQQRAASLYLGEGMPLRRVALQTGLPSGEILRAAALYLAQRRHLPQPCRACPWRCAGRPCVWPQGLCPGQEGRRRA